MNRKNKLITTLFIFLGTFTIGISQKNKTSSTNSDGSLDLKLKDSLTKSFLNQIKFRMIGPATTSGRIVDIAVNPENHSEYYIAAAYGGVWKTKNAGTTFEPIFDNYGTQSIGCLAIDPQNTHVIWVGTGENNNQRSVGYGNGIYKSTDGGKSFTNMGLKNSEHIGMIKINPTNSKDIWVAAYGPLWKEGGERGIYHSTDAGKTWILAFNISKNTGCNEIHFDPFQSGVIYAAFHQRRRHEWTYLGGGPESALYKSEDNGLTWNKLGNGFPSGELGRITLGVSVKKGLLYTMVEASNDKGGIFVSHDHGASWSKVNSFTTAGNYYQELMTDPINPNKFYVMDMMIKVSEDGGKTLKNLGEPNKHVDNHAIWVNPSNGEHMIVGCDGGLYETFNHGKEWNFKDNISITQFYRVSTDNNTPFYNIYGGTQDNNSLGGPSRNNSANGISNAEWFVTVGGDGFKSQVDPKNPNIVYSQWQYGGLIRFDKKTGESMDIKPVSPFGAGPLKWNWDAPLIISKYNNRKLYFAANKVFMSEDMGNSWKLISNDLSRGIDRNTLPVMEKVWGLDAVVKNQSTSIYGNITGLTEGAKGQLYACTDDGLTYVTNDDGATWTKMSEMFPNGPAAAKNGAGYPFVSMIQAGRSANTVYVVLDHHRFGDFQPYVYKSIDNGKNWTKITKGLPENGPVKCILEDNVDSDVLLVGTEFGFYISINGGQTFINWQGGMPPVPIKDIVHQVEQDDIVLATFGRGFAVCDDYDRIREFKATINAKETTRILTPLTAMLYIPSSPLGGSGNGYKGASRFMAPNATEKAVLYYNIQKEFPSIKSRREKRETENSKNPNALIYPSKDSIFSESNETTAKLFISVYQNTDKFGEIKSLKNILIARWSIPASKGWAKTEWNLKHSIKPVVMKTDDKVETSWGPYVNNGDYSIVIEEYNNGLYQSISTPILQRVQYLYEPTIPFDQNRNQKINTMNEVRSEIEITENKLSKLKAGINAIAQGIQHYSVAGSTYQFYEAVSKELIGFNILLYGNSLLAAKEFETVDGIISRFWNAYYSTFDALNAPTETHYQVFTDVREQLKSVNLKFETLKNQYNDYLRANPGLGEMPFMW